MSGDALSPRTYTRAELDAMGPDELVANADDIVAASREGRITDQTRAGGTTA